MTFRCGTCRIYWPLEIPDRRTIVIRGKLHGATNLLARLHGALVLRAAIDGDLGKARKLYNASTETGVTEFYEYAYAHRALRRMDAKPQAAESARPLT